MLATRSGLAVLCVVVGVLVGAQEARLEVRLVTDEAEAVLALLDQRADGDEPGAEAWERLFASDGYRRLKAREAAMNRTFTDDEFRSFVVGDSLLGRREQLRATLAAWTSADLTAAAQRAFDYLTAHAAIRAKVYPVMKPRPNSFVFEPATDPAIFLYPGSLAVPGAAGERGRARAAPHRVRGRMS